MDVLLPATSRCATIATIATVATVATTRATIATVAAIATIAATATRVRVPGHLDEHQRQLLRMHYRAARLSSYLLRWRHCGPVVFAEGDAVHAGQRRRP